MTAASTGKPARKPRTNAERTALRLEIEQRVKLATPEQRAASLARQARHKAGKGK